LAFDDLKRAFTIAPILGHWDPDLPIILETDTSDRALAAILSTRSGGEIHPIAFHSRAFSAAEINYDVHDKELLAIVESFKKWRHYLEGVATPVEVYTDHKNLTYFSETKTLSRRLARWSEFLSQFNLSISFQPGRLGKKPDALTRRWDVYGEESSREPPDQRPVFTQNQLLPCTANLENQSLTLQAVTLTDPQSLLSNIKEAQKSHQPDVNSLAVEKTLKDPRWTKEADGLWHYEGQIYVPDVGDLRLQVLKSRHNHMLAGHLGQIKTYQLVRREFNWPNLRDFVIDFIRSCNTCGRNKARHHKPYGLLKQLPIPSRPWKSISMDFIEQLPPSEGHTDILAIID